MLLTQAEIEAVRRPYRSARLLPPRVFHDPGIFAFEQDNWFARDWICVGREDTAGRHSNQEDSVHAFDLLCADRYAGDGVRTPRDIKEPLQGAKLAKGRRAATPVRGR
jgi:hypothetical protein